MKRHLIVVSFLTLASFCQANTLTVGPEQSYATIEAANAAAKSGDTIAIFPTTYLQPAILVTKPNLKFIGQGQGVVLDGTGFDYSGSGSTPRAIFQINPSATGVTIENLELRGAHNASFNGAGVRINQAKNVTVRKCRIHENDMGIMSNGDGSSTNSAANQLIDQCTIFQNGNTKDPGQNHNLYLGGTNVTVQFCDIYGATTGHNLKSRAHFNLIQYNKIHDSANRELDLVDGWDTSRPNSNSVLLGNQIIKRVSTNGNRAVIHFGQDGGGAHDGTIFLINNTIITTYQSAVLQLTAVQARAKLFNSIIFNPEQNAPTLLSVPSDVSSTVVEGNNNWISRAYSLEGSGISAATRFMGPTRDSDPGFVNALSQDYFLKRDAATYSAMASPYFIDSDGVSKIEYPRFQFEHQAVKWSVKTYLGAGLRPLIQSASSGG